MDATEMQGAARGDGRLALALLRDGEPHWAVLALVAGLPVALAAWALLASGRVLIEFGATDFLFNLAGGWQVFNGRLPHVDFHEPVGLLTFWLTALGFRLVGPTPLALPVGETIACAALFGAAMVAAGRRLALVPAASFVLFAALPAIMPFNVGESLDSYSFAVAYNRYGWGAMAILALILFVPPRGRRTGSWPDLSLALALLIALFYTKITYFLVGLALLAAALAVAGHLRAARPAWIAVLALAAANALAPYSHPYLADIHWHLAAGAAPVGPGSLLRVVFANGAECALYGMAFVAGLVLWRSGRAPLRVPVAVGLLLAAGLALLSQNTQAQGLPLGAVGLFVLYVAATGLVGPGRAVPAVPVLAALLLMPLMASGAVALGLAGYWLAASQPAALWIADRTNLHGLALPGTAPRNPAQARYLASLLEITDWFAATGGQAGRVQLLDRVNPLPFMLGEPPPHGGDLWWDSDFPLRPPAEILGDADYVVLAKAPARLLPAGMHASYLPYIEANFPHRAETAGWIIYGRRSS